MTVFYAKGLDVLTIKEECRNIQLGFTLSTLPALHWAAVSVFLYYTCFDIFVCFLFTVVFKQITHSSIQISTNCQRNRTESVKYAFQLTKRILN